jgi:streptomycin 6-kinase
VTASVLEGAIEEAHRRAAISDRDLSASVEHFSRSLGPVCERWALKAEGWFPGGAGSPVLAVTTPDGAAAVLKIGEPGILDAAARVMRSADGRGYARILDWDAHRGAQLVERLGADLWSEQPQVSGQGPVIAALLLDAWGVPLVQGSPFTGKAAGLLAILRDLGPRYGEDHDRPLQRAISYARALMLSERPEVVCHGDPHAGNVLRRGAEWALIDPDGFVGERSYDIGVVLRDACREIASAEESAPGSGAVLLRNECRRLAALVDVDPERVWRWAFIERVTTGLYLRWHGYDDEAAGFLDTAALLDRCG